MPVVPPPPVSRFAFAKPHEITTGRVAVTGTPLDGKPCLLGHFTLRPGKSVADAFLAISPNRNPPPPGGIRHHMLRGATDDTFFFLDILDSYAAVANCLKRLEAHPQALADLAEVVEPGGEAWIGPLSCVPSTLVPRAVIVELIKHGATNVTTEPRPSAFHKSTVPADATLTNTNPATAAAVVVAATTVDSSTDDSWIPPPPPPPASNVAGFPAVDTVFASRYWRRCAINWYTRRPFEPVCSAEVHAYEVEPVWFEMGPSAPAAGAVAPTPPSPIMSSVTRRGYGDAKQQYTYQHRPHDPPVYRVAEDHGTCITRCGSEEEGLSAATAAFSQLGFRNLQMRGTGTVASPVVGVGADESTIEVGAASAAAVVAVASGSDAEGGGEAERQQRRRGRKPPPMCAQVVDSTGKRRRCHVDPRRVPHLDVGDVIVMAMVTLSQQSQPRHSPLTAISGLGRVTAVSRWSRRKAAVGQQLAEDQRAQQLRAVRRATLADVSAAAAAAGGAPLPWDPAAAAAVNAAIGHPFHAVMGIYLAPHLPYHPTAAPSAMPTTAAAPSVFVAVDFNRTDEAVPAAAAAQDVPDEAVRIAAVDHLQRAVAATCGVAPGTVGRIDAAAAAAAAASSHSP